MEYRVKRTVKLRLFDRRMTHQVYIHTHARVSGVLCVFTASFFFQTLVTTPFYTPNVYVYVCMCTCMCTYVQVCVGMYMCVNVRTCRCACMYMHAYACVCVCKCVCDEAEDGGKSAYGISKHAKPKRRHSTQESGRAFEEHPKHVPKYAQPQPRPQPKPQPKC